MRSIIKQNKVYKLYIFNTEKEVKK